MVLCRKKKRDISDQDQQGRYQKEDIGRQVGSQSVGVKDLAVILDDRVGDERRDDPRDEDEEDDAEAFKLSLGIFREKLLHPDRGDLPAHDVAAAEEEESAPQRPVHDGRRIDEFRFAE